jgi:Mrp family chromosome partitioning ATPase/predicted Fe-Mo cluster-binding NifX family protein
LIVLSGKGGVGKSTVAANLAVAAARAGLRTGLLDVDVHGPTIPQLLGLTEAQPEAEGEAIVPVPAMDRLGVMSLGFLLPGRDDAVIWRGPMKHTVIRQFLADVEWGELDLLVVDSPPGTGDEPLSVIQLIADPDGAVVVTTPQAVAVADVRRSIGFCRRLALPVLGVVENMSGFRCPHCGRESDLFGTGGGEALAEEAGVPFLGRIPFDPRITASGDAGQAYVATVPDPPGAAVFKTILSPEETEEGARPMRYAVPLAGGVLSAHFGHCEEFALVDVDPETGRVVEVRRSEPPPHEPGALPRWLKENGAGAVIAGGMGRRAQDLFAESGIEVILGARPAPPEELVQAHLGGELERGPNICDH